MQYTYSYSSPLGEILLAADAVGLTGLWFVGQKHFGLCLDKAHEAKTIPVFAEAERWLDCYFAGRCPDFTPPLHFLGTPFQKAVWAILLAIPYGETVTYGEIARRYAAANGLASMSAQAVGGAIGRNPISMIVPCHRVVGANGSLTGYAGGLSRKIALLELEGVKTVTLSFGGDIDT